MLNQLIYTRCMPHRELKNKGMVSRVDGFGVFSMSQEMILNSQGINYDFLQSRLANPNGAKENSAVGLFNSYEYTELQPDVYALCYEVARPLCKENRKNGIAHRSGTFVKQCFVGTPKDYPFMWFGTAAWNAHLRSENDYYLDEDPKAEPEFLQLVKDIPTGGYITADKVKTFVNDGRIEAVKAGIWFLIQEYSKPQNERKVLLIKDVPENVELWIAAIGYAFSPELAQKISFSTNKTRLGTQIDSNLFYYTDASGRFYPMLNKSIQQTRHPYNMIVGFHPRDPFCAAVKQMPTSNFVMIDGTTKKASFVPDETIREPYYAAAVKYDADIVDFCSVVLPSLPIHEITDKILEMYNAYKYLLDSNHKVEKWSYRESVSALCALLQFGMPKNEVLCKYILDEGIRGYQKFAAEDEKNSFTLLKVLWNISITIKRHREVTGCLADRLSNGMVDLKNAGNTLAATWNAIKTSSAQNIVQPALKELFNDGDLKTYSCQFHNASTVAVSTILNMYYETFKSEKAGLGAILENDTRYQFVCLGLANLLDDNSALCSSLECIQQCDELFDWISFSVSEYIERYTPEKLDLWLNAVIYVSGGNVIELCKVLCKSPKTNIAMVEKLLASSILKEKKCDKEKIEVFNDAMKLLTKNKNTGVDFYKAWIKIADVSEADQIIRAIRGSAVFSDVEKELFKKIDACLPYSASSGKISMVFRSMKEWGDKLGVISKSVAFNDLKRNLENERKPEKAVDVLNEFSKLKIALPEGFLSEYYFEEIAVCAAEFYAGEVHMAFLMMFEILDEREWKQYVHAYVKKAFDTARGKQVVYTMLSLCDASFYEYKIPGKKITQVKEVSELLDSCFKKVLPDYYKASLIEQVEKTKEYDEKVKEKLVQMLNEAAQKAKNNGPKGSISAILGGLFGKK